LKFRLSSLRIDSIVGIADLKLCRVDAMSVSQPHKPRYELRRLQVPRDYDLAWGDVGNARVTTSTLERKHLALKALYRDSMAVWIKFSDFALGLR
jgi:hypothetical protein